MTRTARGIRNNNPGNLRLPLSLTRPGDMGHDADGFSVFSTPEHGLDSLARQLVNYGKRGLNTVLAITYRWAPPADNETYAYAHFIARHMKVDTDAPLDMVSTDVIAGLMAAMITFENGDQPYPRTTLFNSAQKAVTGVKKT